MWHRYRNQKYKKNDFVGNVRLRNEIFILSCSTLDGQSACVRHDGSKHSTCSISFSGCFVSQHKCRSRHLLPSPSRDLLYEALANQNQQSFLANHLNFCLLFSSRCCATPAYFRQIFGFFYSSGFGSSTLVDFQCHSIFISFFVLFWLVSSPKPMSNLARITGVNI